MQKLITTLERQVPLTSEHIQNILKLLEDGATIPFIARYRKEMTGGASDEVLREFETIYETAQKLLTRKEAILRLIDEKGLLTPKLQESIAQAQTLTQVEDIYLPYKSKKSSRASKAIDAGYELLANRLHRGEDITQVSKEAIQGAQDILAERYSELAREREAIRNNMLRHGILEIKKTKHIKEDSLYKNFVDKSEKIAFIPSHRYLAIMRGVSEKELSVKISVDEAYIIANIEKYKIPKNASAKVKKLLVEAYKDGLKRLLLPSISREVHNIVKERADDEAIKTFGKNLEQLLMSPPVKGKIILGVDPAYKSGTKLAVIDADASYLDSCVVYPFTQKERAIKMIEALYKKYKINAVAIGNGTASHETQEFFAALNELIDLPYTVVSEAGASVYSASKLAQEEYPDLDVTIRGAISIAQRLRDPMAALVKIDPKSLGIGQYQHDVDQKKLVKKLDDVIEDVVNRVGVDINSASAALLEHVAGLSKSMAKNIVAYCDRQKMQSKMELLKVKGVGAKAFEQAAGFIRIRDGKSIYDNSAIHPESYAIAEAIEGKKIDDIALEAKKLGCGEATLRDIIKELQKPGFDLRETLEPIPFKKGLNDITMLQEGSIISGVIRNITDFGAFVDIGLKNDGLIHISQMSQKRIKHPLEVLSLNQYLAKIEVLSVDYKSQKVSLSIKNY